MAISVSRHLHEKGDKCIDVALAQGLLFARGTEVSDPLGVFGEDTRVAVEEFQKEHRIQATGILNLPTWEALESLDVTQKDTADDSDAVSGQEEE